MPTPQKPIPPGSPLERQATLVERPPGPPIERSGTVLETDDDVREALMAGQGAPKPTSMPAKPPARTASPFRPTARPPVAMLTVFDDGKTDGETIRIRDTKFVIGRTEGDLRIPIDGRMSAKHLEITHQVIGGLHRWVLTDLQSSHGLFVRVSKTVLADQFEFLVGGGRYRFEAARELPHGDTVEYKAPESNTAQTQGWNDGNAPFRPAALTELIGREIGDRTLLVKDEYWVGSDFHCAICRADDPFCESKHARVFRTARGGWGVEHFKTANGLWVKMPQITVESVVRFQIGEQRFMLKVR